MYNPSHCRPADEPGTGQSPYLLSSSAHFELSLWSGLEPQKFAHHIFSSVFDNLQKLTSIFEFVAVVDNNSCLRKVKGFLRYQVVAPTVLIISCLTCTRKDRVSDTGTSDIVPNCHWDLLAVAHLLCDTRNQVATSVPYLSIMTVFECVAFSKPPENATSRSDGGEQIVVCSSL